MILHQDDQVTFERCRDIAFNTADRFGLSLREFMSKRQPNVNGCQPVFGLCYYEKARIVIVFRFRIKTVTGLIWFSVPVQLKVVLDSIGHVLAHLRYPDHGWQFKAFAVKIIDYILETYYNPYTLDFKLASGD